jgi:hypothetical protein
MNEPGTRFKNGVAQFTDLTPSCAALGTATIPGVKTTDQVIRVTYLSGTTGAITGTPVDITAYCSFTAANTMTVATGSSTATGGVFQVTWNRYKKT